MGDGLPTSVADPSENREDLGLGAERPKKRVGSDHFLFDGAFFGGVPGCAVSVTDWAGPPNGVSHETGSSGSEAIDFGGDTTGDTGALGTRDKRGIGAGGGGLDWSRGMKRPATKMRTLCTYV